jgi:hypothetical protein
MLRVWTASKWVRCLEKVGAERWILVRLDTRPMSVDLITAVIGIQPDT